MSNRVSDGTERLRIIFIRTAWFCRDRLIEICKKYGVDMRTAALQFCAAHPAVIQVLTGCRNPQQIQENYISLNGGVMLPQDFWAELKQKGIVNKAAPTPV